MKESRIAKPELFDADMVLFLGDFNYQVFGISYDEGMDFLSQRHFYWLREKDQLREDMRVGKVFQAMREAIIKFPSTYKFERHLQGLGDHLEELELLLNGIAMMKELTKRTKAKIILTLLPYS